MSTTTWKFLVNTFFVQTVGTLRKALSLTQDHLAKLTANESDPDIAAIKTAYLPFHNAFVTAWNQLNSKLGLYHGQTQTFEEMVEEMSGTELNKWRGVVFNVFPEGTADARAIFPDERKSFQKGTYDERVERVETFAMTLATYTTKPTLIALGLVVQAYYLTLTGARALQQSNEGAVATLRTNLKAAHKLMCDAMYRNLAMLMAKFYQTPLQVADYFDLSLIREGREQSPVELGGGINPLQIINLTELIGEIDATPDTVIRMKNTSTTAATLIFYGANDPADSPGAGPQFTVMPGDTLEKTVAELHLDTLENFNVQNNSAFAGNWEVKILL